MGKKQSDLINYRTIQALEQLPKDVFKKSALVDFLSFIATRKPCIRTQITNDKYLPKFISWCIEYNCHYYIDESKYIFVSNNKNILEKAIEYDLSPAPHAYELGLILGYPACCCRFIAHHGESEIDKLSDELSTLTYQGMFELINPKYYIIGSGFISHVPCSPVCTHSLILAKKTLRFIANNTKSLFSLPWHWGLKYHRRY